MSQSDAANRLSRGLSSLQTSNNNSEPSSGVLTASLSGSGSAALYQDSLIGGGSIFENAESDSALNQFNIGSTQISTGPTPPGYNTGSRKYDAPKQRVAAPRVVGNHWLNSPIYVLDTATHEAPVRPSGPQNYGRGQNIPGSFFSGGSIDGGDTSLNKGYLNAILFPFIFASPVLYPVILLFIFSSQIRSSNAQAILRQQVYQFSSNNVSAVAPPQQAKAGTPTTLSIPNVSNSNSSVQLPNGSYVRSDSGRSKFF